MSRKHYFIAIGVGGSTVSLYAMTSVWQAPEWLVALAVMVGGFFAALAFLNPVDPTSRFRTREQEPPPLMPASFERVTLKPAQTVDKAFTSPPEDTATSAPTAATGSPQQISIPAYPGATLPWILRLAYSLSGLFLVVVGAALFFGIPVSVAAGYRYAAEASMSWIDVAQYRWTYGLLFTIPMLVMGGFLFLREVSSKVTGVVVLVVWAALYWIGNAFYDDLGVVTNIGRAVAQWWAG